MMTHHIITVALMVASYFYNFTRVGCLIMVLMDCCDIWLPVSVDDPASSNRLLMTIKVGQNAALSVSSQTLRHDLRTFHRIMAYHPSLLLRAGYMVSVSRCSSSHPIRLGSRARTLSHTWNVYGFHWHVGFATGMSPCIPDDRPKHNNPLSVPTNTVVPDDT